MILSKEEIAASFGQGFADVLPEIPKQKKKKKLKKRKNSDTKTIEIYTDGGCWPNPGDSGYGAVILAHGQPDIEIFGGEKSPSTNQRAELMAPIFALEYLKEPSNITLYSDSRYVIDGITDWIHNWKQNGWRNSQGKPVANRDLWEKLDKARSRHNVRFQWVKGHSGIEGNERADKLSQKGAIEACGNNIDFDKFRWK